MRHIAHSGYRVAFAAVLTVGVIWISLAFLSIQKKSAAVDEVPHFGSGLAVLNYHDFRMNPEHPPLIKVLATLPVYWFCRPDLRIDRGNQHISAWENSLQEGWGYVLLQMSGRDPLTLLKVARIVPIFIGFFGGLLAFFVARTLGLGPLGCVLSAILLWFYPEYFGHARFLTLDVPTLFGCAVVTFLILKWWRRPTVGNVVAVAITCGICSQIKLPVTLFIVFQLGTIFVLLLGRRPGRLLKEVTPEASNRVVVGKLRAAPRLSIHSFWLLLAGVVVCIYGACWLSAGFRFSHTAGGQVPQRLSPYLPPMTGGGSVAAMVNFLYRHKLLPEATLATLSHAMSFRGREMYFFGHKSLYGWYSYFFVTYALKTPLAFSFATLIVIGIAAWQSTRLPRYFRTTPTRIQLRFLLKMKKWAILCVPFTVMFFFFVRSRPNIGHRQVLFIYFPLAIAVAWLAAEAWKRGGVMRIAAFLLVALQIGNMLAAFPHDETYFNELIRTPYCGSQYVVDSNVDWATDVPLVSEFMKQNGMKNINYAAMGHNRPQSYGIPEFRWLLPNYPHQVGMPDAVPPDPHLPTAVSLNCLSSVRYLYPGMYDREPSVILNSMLIFGSMPAP